MDKNEFTENEKKIVEALEKGTALSLGELQRQSGMSMQAVINGCQKAKANGIVNDRVHKWSLLFSCKDDIWAVSDW